MINRFRQINGVTTLEFFEYNLKCFVGVAIGYLLLKAFRDEAGLALWLLISILLSITHDNNSKVAYDRMKANILGSAVGIFAFFLHTPWHLLTICIGVTITIAICFTLGLMTVSRTALVALIIVVFYNESQRTWRGAIERVTCVVAGCVIGLIINYLFRKLILTLYGPIPAAHPTPQEIKRDAGE